MKRIIDGKTYNTETAVLIADFWNGLSSGDFHSLSEELYLTRKGTFFIAGEGGALTSYAEAYANMSGSGAGIRVISQEAALAWCEAHDFIDEAELYFSDLIEEG